jgi:hypothetical protein|eukprot:COSAG06_NODE_1552_length_9123_cov_3.052970_7_plen_137_part_00
MEQGPAVSAALLILVVILAIHTITCLWYYVGTIPSVVNQKTNGTVVAGRASTGWVDQIFQGSSRLCDCYPEVQDQAYFYDAYDNYCIHPDDDLPVESICSRDSAGLMNIAPTVWDYYYKGIHTFARFCMLCTSCRV